MLLSLTTFLIRGRSLLLPPWGFPAFLTRKAFYLIGPPVLSPLLPDSFSFALPLGIKPSPWCDQLFQFNESSLIPHTPPNNLYLARRGWLPPSFLFCRFDLLSCVQCSFSIPTGRGWISDNFVLSSSLLVACSSFSIFLILSWVSLLCMACFSGGSYWSSSVRARSSIPLISLGKSGLVLWHLFLCFSSKVH